MKAVSLNLEDTSETQLASEQLIRHAYEQVLTHCARLSLYASGKPPRTDGPIYERQEMLAVDDLASFAYHARRLMSFTSTNKRFSSVLIPTVDINERIPITKVLNIIIHQELIETIRYDWKLRMLSGREDRWKIVAEADDKLVPTMIFIKSDQSKYMMFRLEYLIEIFQKQVLSVIINICAEQSIYLESF